MTWWILLGNDFLRRCFSNLEFYRAHCERSAPSMCVNDRAHWIEGHDCFQNQISHVVFIVNADKGLKQSRYHIIRYVTLPKTVDPCSNPIFFQVADPLIFELQVKSPSIFCKVSPPNTNGWNFWKLKMTLLKEKEKHRPKVAIFGFKMLVLRGGCNSFYHPYAKATFTPPPKVLKKNVAPWPIEDPIALVLRIRCGFDTFLWWCVGWSILINWYTCIGCVHGSESFCTAAIRWGLGVTSSSILVCRWFFGKYPGGVFFAKFLHLTPEHWKIHVSLKQNFQTKQSSPAPTQT